MREIKRDVQKYTWNRVNTKIGCNYSSRNTEGIENIKPPIRLFIPYVSYYQQDDFAADRTFKGA
jgi:hypothetical protein